MMGLGFQLACHRAHPVSPAIGHRAPSTALTDFSLLAMRWPNHPFEDHFPAQAVCLQPELVPGD